MRLPIYSEALTSLPDGWVTGQPWTFGPNGMTSPVTNQSWVNHVESRRYCRVEQRLTRCGLTALSSGTLAVLATLAVDGNGPLYEGNGRGPSQVGVDWAAGALRIYGQPSGEVPGIAAETPLVAGHAWANRQLFEWGWHQRLMTATITDTVTQAQTTVSYDRTSATDTNSNAGNCNDSLAFFAPAGQFVVDSLDVLYDDPSVNLPIHALILGDSITEGDQTLVANRYAQILYNQLGGRLAISAMGGGRARGAYMTGLSEIPALKPKWVIWAVGANLSVPEVGADATLGTALWTAYTKNIIRLAKSYGAKVILTPLMDTPYSATQGGYAAINAEMATLAAADPTNVFLWRWKRALSVGGTGTTQDLSLYHDDKAHPIDAGHAKLAAQMHIDVPQFFDVRP